MVPLFPTPVMMPFLDRAQFAALTAIKEVENVNRSDISAPPFERIARIGPANISVRLRLQSCLNPVAAVAPDRNPFRVAVCFVLFHALFNTKLAREKANQTKQTQCRVPH